MSDNETSRPSEDKTLRRVHLRQSQPKTDRRVRRTRERLGDALIELIQQKPFDAITVQDVLDRAGVARSTFYLHYRDKHDLFLSDADEFLEAMATALSRCRDTSERVAPVREFFTHIAEAEPLYNALVEAGRIQDFLELAQEHFARGIERRLAELPRAAATHAAARPALAHALAGALISLLTWWLSRHPRTPPEQMDAIFHRIVWSGVGATAPASVNSS
ncbi:MAG TPA: TetR/AcrR family transcriptional regulator [Pyrinomonadaceae bacterium]|jgi:AcrR family transcriptional regulator